MTKYLIILVKNGKINGLFTTSELVYSQDGKLLSLKEDRFDTREIGLSAIDDSGGLFGDRFIEAHVWRTNEGTPTIVHIETSKLGVNLSSKE